jgi:imidazolonepropionase-like amidohydrolase
MQIITAATSGGAQTLERSDELGRIAPGYTADILVVAGDPLADINALARPTLVLHAGREVL